MGRVKSALIKRSGQKLMSQYGEFSDNFEINKKYLGSNTMPSKRLRNMISGYITKKVRAKNKQ